MRKRSVWLVISAAVLVAASSLVSTQTSSGVLLVVVRPDGAPAQLVFVDPASGKVLTRIPGGPDAHAVASSADGKFAFVVNTNSHETGAANGDSISVIDMAARKEIHRVPIGQGAQPHDVRVAGGKVYFSAEGWKSVGRYDPASNKVEWMVGLGQRGPHMLVVSKDLNTIFASNNRSATVSVVENIQKGPSGWDVSQLPVGKGAEGIDVSPDGKEVWTANEGSGNASIIDVAKKTVQNIDLQTKHANRLRFSPDGKIVLLLDREAHEIVAVDTASRKVAKRIKLTGENASDTLHLWDFTVAADGSRAFVTGNSGEGLGARYDAKGDVNRPSAGSRVQAGKRAYIGVIDLKTLTSNTRFPIDAGADGIGWIGAR